MIVICTCMQNILRFAKNYECYLKTEPTVGALTIVEWTEAFQRPWLISIPCLFYACYIAELVNEGNGG